MLALRGFFPEEELKTYGRDGSRLMAHMSHKVPGVTEVIPAQAFIDKRTFRGYKELYRYLKSMPESEYTGYLSAIRSFVMGSEVRPFSAEGFAEHFINQIVPPTLSR